MFGQHFEVLIKNLTRSLHKYVKYLIIILDYCYAFPMFPFADDYDDNHGLQIEKASTLFLNDFLIFLYSWYRKKW